MTLKRHPPLPSDERSGGTPGVCEVCGNLAPKGTRLCRPCRRRFGAGSVIPPATLPNLILENPS